MTNVHMESTPPPPNSFCTASLTFTKDPHCCLLNAAKCASEMGKDVECDTVWVGTLMLLSGLYDLGLDLLPGSEDLDAQKKEEEIMLE